MKDEVLIRIKRETRHLLKIEGAKRGITITKLLEEIISEYFKKKDKK